MIYTYKISDTSLTAQWIKPKPWLPYQCSNCETEQDNGLYNIDINLSKFCPNCGARMINPKYNHTSIDYIDNF